MARKAKGKPLTMRTVRLDDDVWAECQRLGKEHGTINEGLRDRLFPVPDAEYDPPVPSVPEVAKLKMQKRQPETRKRGLRPKGDQTR